MQRLAMINTIAWIIFGITITIVTILIPISFAEENSTYNDNTKDMWREVRRKCIKSGRWIIGLSLLAATFVPTEKELFAIYGIGGTIDYIKSNETTKQLPDKVINALDAWIDKQTVDNNKD